MPVPPDYLVTPAQLARFNVPSAFLSQFVPRTFQINILVGGALGTMQFQWQYAGDNGWSPPVVSSAGGVWAYTLDETFSDLTFAAATYALDATYTVDATGSVSGPDANLTAERYDLRANACSAVTDEAMTLMLDAITPPLLTWGDDARTHAAAMVYAILKRGRGLTPKDDGAPGDMNIFSAENVAREFFKGIGKNGRPNSMTDTSVSADGPLLAAYPVGDPLRGW